MKKMNLTVLTLVTLCLVGCGKRVDSSVTSNPSASASEHMDSEDKESSSSKEDSKPSSEEKLSSVVEEKDSTVESVPSGEDSTVSSPESSTGTDSSVHDYTASKWPHDVQDNMLLYLNGNILPYVQLASVSRNVYSEYDYSTGKLVICGDEFSTSFITLGKQVYEAAGWNTSGSSSTELRAVLDTEGLSIILKEGTGSEEGLITLYAKWNEPFDPSGFTAWPQEILDLFQDKINGNQIPLIYLGTKAPTGELDDMNRIVISGPSWNDQIITLAYDTLVADGWTINSESTYSISATKKMADGWTITLSINKDSLDKPHLVITGKEPFVIPPAGTDWPQEVLDAFDDELAGIHIPYIYLGSSSLTTYRYSAKELDIRSDASCWDDLIITQAQTTYSASNGWYDITDGNGLGYSNAYVAYKDFVSPTDGCTYQIHVKIYKTSAYCVVEVYHEIIYSTPSATSDWSDEIKQYFTDDLNGHVIPFVNLGQPIADWSESSATLTLSGNVYDDQMLTDANDAFTQAGWNSAVAADTTITSYSQVMKANKTFDGDGEDGYTFNVTLYKNYSSSVMKIKVSKPYVAPSGVTDWDQSVKDEFAAHVGGYDIPFVYLNGNTVQTNWSSYSKPHLELTSGVWVDDILTSANTIFADADWIGEIATNTYAGDYGNYSPQMYTATKNYANGDEIRVELYGNYHGAAQMDIYFKNGFNPSSATEWTQDVKDQMVNHLGYELPFIYLGTTSPSVSWFSYYYSNYSCLTISGTTWDDAIFTEALTAYTEADGWVTQLNDGSSVMMAKTMPDHSMLTILVSKSNTTPTMKIYYAEPYTVPAPSASDQWSSTLLSAFHSYLHQNTVPYFYLGSGSFTTDCDYTTSTITYTSTNDDWHDQYVLNARDVLLADGFTCRFGSTLPNQALELIAEKSVEDGAAMISVHVFLFDYFDDNAWDTTYFPCATFSYHQVD